MYDSRPPLPLTSRLWFGRRPYCWWSWCSMWRRGSPRSRNSTPSSWNSSITSTGRIPEFQWWMYTEISGVDFKNGIYVSVKRAGWLWPFLESTLTISLKRRVLNIDIDVKLIKIFQFFPLLHVNNSYGQGNFFFRKKKYWNHLNWIV